MRPETCNTKFMELQTEITVCEAQLENGIYEEGQDAWSTFARKTMLEAMMGDSTVCRTNALCPCCKNHLFTSDVPAYMFVCPVCDENYYGIEVREFDSGLFEVYIPIDEDVYWKKRKDLALAAGQAGVGFNDNMMVLGYRHDQLPPAEDLVSTIRKIERRVI